MYIVWIDLKALNDIPNRHQLVTEYFNGLVNRIQASNN